MTLAALHTLVCVSPAPGHNPCARYLARACRKDLILFILLPWLWGAVYKWSSPLGARGCQSTNQHVDPTASRTHYPSHWRNPERHTHGVSRTFALVRCTVRKDHGSFQAAVSLNIRSVNRNSHPHESRRRRRHRAPRRFLHDEEGNLRRSCRVRVRT